MPRKPNGPAKSRFVSTVVEIEGRSETRIVELPAFDPEPWTEDSQLTIVGASVPRMDAAEKVTGRARYTADIARPGMLYAAIVRAPIARGAIISLDLSAAKKLPGVFDVIGPGDAPAKTRLFPKNISYAGQPVAAVCATSDAAARRAAEAVIIEYKADAFAVTFAAAVAPDAPMVRSTGNLFPGAPITVARGDISAGIAAADVVLELVYRTPVALHTALEPHGAAAEWEGDHLTVWESTQGIFRTRADVARALDLPLTHVRVIKDYMGGGFGAKNGAGAHTYIAAILAKRTGRAVRCVNDREGEQLDSGNRPATTQRVTIGAKKNGVLTAIKMIAEVPLGVVGWEGGPAQIYHELYACKNVHTEETFAFINASGMQAFRGPGYVEGAFGLESAMNEMARALKLDPLEFRKKNFSKRDARQDRPYSGNALLECYEQGARTFGWPHKASPAQGRMRHGFGLAAQVWPTGGGPPSYAQVRLNQDATVDVLAGTQDLGTGSRTVLAQIAAEALGAALSTVHSVIGDTQSLPYSGNSWGSMTTASAGPAVRMAAIDLQHQLFDAAASMLNTTPDTLEAQNSRIVVRDTDRSITFREVTTALGNVVLVGKGSRGPNPDHTAINTFGVQFAEVEVDLDTGIVRVLRIVGVHDAGRIINPLLAASQMEGGILQGLGYALFEERVLDARLGLVMNPTMHDYKIPTMMDLPKIDVSFVAGSDANANHTGARGIAEPAIIPTAPAIAAAVANAIGAPLNEIPLTPWRVLAAIAGAK